MKIFFLFALFLTTSQVFSQLGFCEGSKGDPIFHEDFSMGGPLPTGTTNYTFVDNQDPQDGEYTITENIGNDITTWFSYLPNTTISNKDALIVNADYTAGQFYQYKVSGLCENTSYEFSAFLMNILRAANSSQNGDIPVNVKFQIWDETDTDILAEGSTGDIFATTTPRWEQYALTFKSEPGQNSVILRMYNNSDGGNGNDLAIDDIIFRSCGDLTEISTPATDSMELNVCEENAPVSLDLTATPDFSAYQSHYYQWQESTDNLNWNDIPNENSNKYSISQLNRTTFYRVMVAEDPVNLSNNLCSTVSEAFLVNIVETPTPPVSAGDKTICESEEIPSLSVQTASDEIVNWYASENGTDLLLENSHSFTPEVQGVFFAEAIKEGFECTPSSRTPVELEILGIPEVEDEELQICEDITLELDAGDDVQDYLWNTGETTREISVTTPGTYRVELTNTNGCSVEKEIVVRAVDKVEIEGIISEGRKIIIEASEAGDFEYSLDGTNFQDSPEFDVSGGIYTVYMRDKAGCKMITQEFPHIVFPNFITPNGDGYNDVFRLKGLEYFGNSSIQIFDRYGKLLISGDGENFSWDGTLNGRNLPSDDYWYEIRIEDYPPQKGHFSLIR